jgi:hypothetical protein
MRSQQGRGSLTLVKSRPKLAHYRGLAVDIYAPLPHNQEALEKAILEIQKATTALTKKLLPRSAKATIKIRQVWCD